jgi:hypothetical protein
MYYRTNYKVTIRRQGASRQRIDGKNGRSKIGIIMKRVDTGLMAKCSGRKKGLGEAHDPNFNSGCFRPKYKRSSRRVDDPSTDRQVHFQTSMTEAEWFFETWLS